MCMVDSFANTRTKSTFVKLEYCRMARYNLFPGSMAAKLLVCTVLICCTTIGLCCRAVPRDCPEQCECLLCWPVMQCNGENVTDFNFTQSVSWVSIFIVANTNIPELQKGTIVLPYLPNVVQLQLPSNGITTLTEQLFVTNYTRLSNLILTDNKLTVIPSRLMQLAPRLSYIDLTQNLIAVIPSYAFRFNTGLRVIILGYNNVETVEENAFAGLTELQTLNISNNKLVGPFLGHWEEFHTSIKEIYLSGNDLRQIPPLNQSYEFACEELILEHNKIETLEAFSLAGFGALILFNVENNSLSSIDGKLFGKGNHDLEMLYLSRNKLTSVPVVLLSRLPKLANLSLSFNRITTLPSKAFVKNEKLKWLLLDHNVITSVDSLSLQGLNGILYLDIQANRLTGFPKTFLKGKYAFDIILADNMWSCNCDMKTLQDWFSEYEIEHVVQCQSPPAYEGQNITAVDFGIVCNEEKEREEEEEKERIRKMMEESKMIGFDSSLYALIGGGVGVIVVMSLLVAIFIYRRKMRTQSADIPLCKSEPSVHNSAEK